MSSRYDEVRKSSSLERCRESSSLDRHSHRHDLESCSVDERDLKTSNHPSPESSLLDPVCDEHCSDSVHALSCRELPAEDGTPLPCADDWFYADRAVIGRLNDVTWVDSCFKALQHLPLDHRHQLICLSQTPTMFPVAALRLGLVSSVVFVDLDPVLRPLIRRLLAANHIGADRVTFSRPWQRDVASVLFADIVSPEGCLRQNVFELIHEARCDLSYITCSLFIEIFSHCNHVQIVAAT